MSGGTEGNETASQYFGQQQSSRYSHVNSFQLHFHNSDWNTWKQVETAPGQVDLTLRNKAFIDRFVRGIFPRRTGIRKIALSTSLRT